MPPQPSTVPQLSSHRMIPLRHLHTLHWNVTLLTQFLPRSLKRSFACFGFDAKSFYFSSSFSLRDIYYSMDSTCKHIWRNMCEIFFSCMQHQQRSRRWREMKISFALCCVSWVWHAFYVLSVNIHASHHRLFFLHSLPSALNSTFMCSQAKMRQQKWKISFYKMLSHMCVFHLVLLLARIRKGI